VLLLQYLEEVLASRRQKQESDRKIRELREMLVEAGVDHDEQEEENRRLKVGY
jgi:hypothetical protein